MIIDELGGQSASTNSESITHNFALMWAISEFVLSLNNCLTIISTHNFLLNNMCQTYFNTNLLQFNLDSHKCKRVTEENDPNKEATQLDPKQFNHVFFNLLKQNKGSIEKGIEGQMFRKLTELEKNSI